MNTKDYILKHPWSIRVFHLFLAASFVSLAVSGIIVHYKPFADATMRGVMQIHLIAAVVLTLDVFALLLLCTDRIIIFLVRIFSFSVNDLHWLLVLGGYPQKFLLRKAVPVPPMGKYNTGQKIFGILVVFGGTALIITGWGLWGFVHLLPRQVGMIFGFVHLWLTWLFVPFLAVHFFLGMYMFDEFKAMFFTGTVPYKDAQEKSPLWVRDELVQISESTR